MSCFLIRGRQKDWVPDVVQTTGVVLDPGGSGLLCCSAEHDRGLAEGAVQKDKRRGMQNDVIFFTWIGSLFYAPPFVDLWWKYLMEIKIQGKRLPWICNKLFGAKKDPNITESHVQRGASLRLPTRQKPLPVWQHRTTQLVWNENISLCYVGTTECSTYVKDTWITKYN